jgi:AhpD family alkylhydroperoxidase
MPGNISERITKQNLESDPFLQFLALQSLPIFTGRRKINLIIAMGLVGQFNEYRTKMNEKIMEADNLIIKRIFNLDTNAYQAGSLDVKSKELIGLTCSLVLRCDDCVRYHLEKCKEVGFSTAEVQEAMGVATLIGGTIVIPHLRRAFEFWEELQHV